MLTTLLAFAGWTIAALFAFGYYLEVKSHDHMLEVAHRIVAASQEAWADFKPKSAKAETRIYRN